MKTLLLLFFLFSFLSQALSVERMTYPKANSLHEAVFFGDIERVKKLIKKGTDVNDTSGERYLSGSSVVSFSFTGPKQIKNLKRINERRARLKNTLLTDWLKNINDNNQSQKANKGTTPLHWIRNDNVEIAKLLIDNGADVNAKTKEYFKTKFGKFTDSSTISIPAQSTPLDLAILNEHIKTAKLLIDNGADLNAKYNYGYTPLHTINNIDIIQLLIDKGTDVNAKNNTGNTPLHYAKNLKIAKLLIDNGADVNAKNNTGNTPLHYTQTLEIAKLLIDNGADVNAKNKRGNTPLYHEKDLEIAKLLIDKGADVNLINNSGKSLCDKPVSIQKKIYIKKKGGCFPLIIIPKKIWHLPKKIWHNIKSLKCPPYMDSC